MHLPPNFAAMIFAILVTLYFWRRNIKGIHESSDDSLRIMYITTVMVAIIIGWGVFTLLTRDSPPQLPPAPVPGNLEFTPEALGWLRDTGWFEPAGDGEHFRIIGGAGSLLALIGFMIAFGHSVLAMSGGETLAQVSRELEYPKLKNLKRTALVIFIFSILFTSLVSFLAVALIPDGERQKYLDNLISGLAMYFVGPEPLRLLFQAFVVIVGFLMLSGAVNTSLIASNAVLNRVSEDGVLTPWFRRPHKKFGTTYRIITLIVVMQILTILGSRGNIFVLGEAYAFGVIWGFTFNAIATVVLRFKRPEKREWKVPLNPRLGKIEIPMGLLFIAFTLFFIALVNLLTKEIATIAGMTITLAFFTIFTISERINQRQMDRTMAALDQFQLQHQETVEQQAVGSRPGNVLVAVRDYNTLSHLEHVLSRAATGDEQDIVVMTTRVITAAGGGDAGVYDESMFSEYEQRLFTRVVALAEKHGKHVDLLIVPSNNVFDAVAQAAVRLDSAEIATGLSAKMSAQEQSRLFGRAWENVREQSRRQVRFTIVEPGGAEHTVALGAHTPNLTEEDINLIHDLWLQVSNIPSRRRVHHRDVVRVALNRLRRDLRGQSDVMLDFYKLEHEEDRDRSRQNNDRKK
jgi:amino acid transporter